MGHTKKNTVNTDVNGTNNYTSEKMTEGGDLIYEVLFSL